MSLAWRLVWSSALFAGLVLTFSGCKSGGGVWAPGWAKLGSGSSASNLAVSRPTTKVPTPSSGAKPSSADSLASSSTPRTQNGPYGSSSISDRAGSTNSSYGNRPAAWQGEPHSSVAPAGGYETGGQYSMASRPTQSGAASSAAPGVTPGAYAQPYGGAYPDSRAAAQPGPTNGQVEPAADPYSGGSVYGAAAPAETNTASAASSSDPAAGAIYPDVNQGSAGAVPDPSAGSGAPPPSDAPGAVMDPSAATVSPDQSSVYGDAGASGGAQEATNPAVTGTSSTPSAPVIANPYSLPANPPATTSPATTSPVTTSPPATTSPAPTSSPTTSPSSATAPFIPPTLPSSLSGSPGGYRPGSTASPGSQPGSGTIYEPSTTASGTGYSTPAGTIMR